MDRVALCSPRNTGWTEFAVVKACFAATCGERALIACLPDSREPIAERIRRFGLVARVVDGGVEVLESR